MTLKAFPQQSEKGLTLIEVLASLVILSIIIVSLLSIFVQSSKTNRLSKNIMNATYLAETQIEEINNLNNNLQTKSLDELSKQVLTKGYTTIGSSIDPSCTGSTKCFGMSKAGQYVYVQLKTNSADIGKVLVKVYRDDTRTNQAAQMEMILSWKN